MKTRTLALTLLAAFALSGCEDFDVVDKSKYDVVDKSKYVAISKSEYEQLRAAALEAKQVGRYQLHRDGYRTWRLDTATGKSCLLLATEADWKAGAKGQASCAVEDYLEGKRLHDLFPTLYDQYGNPIPQQQPRKQTDQNPAGTPRFLVSGLRAKPRDHTKNGARGGSRTHMRHE